MYALRLTFSEQYPEKPPRVRFTCQMFHPNGALFVAGFAYGVDGVLWKTGGLFRLHLFDVVLGPWSW